MNVYTNNEGSRTSFFPTGTTAMDEIKIKAEFAKY